MIPTDQLPPMIPTKPAPEDVTVREAEPPQKRRKTESVKAQLIHLAGIVVGTGLFVLGVTYQSKPGFAAAFIVALATNAKTVVVGIFDTIAARFQR